MSQSPDNGEVIYKKGQDDSEIDEIWDDTELIKAYDKAVNLAYDAANANLKASGDLNDHKFAAPAAKPKHQNHKQETDDGDEKLSASTSKKTKKRSKGRKKKNIKWNVGDVCMAKFTEDDLYYECTIVSVDTSNDACVVRFAGYGNEEEKPVASLRRLSEWITENTVSDSAEESQSSDLNSSCDSVHNKISHEASQFAFHKMMSNMANDGDEIGNTTAVPLLPPPMPPGFLRPNDGMPSDNEAMASMLMSWYMSGYHTGYYQALTDVKKKRSKQH